MQVALYHRWEPGPVTFIFEKSAFLKFPFSRKAPMSAKMIDDLAKYSWSINLKQIQTSRTNKIKYGLKDILKTKNINL